MGTILADFVHIVEDGLVTPDGMSKNFDTGGIRTERSVILMFSVAPLPAHFRSNFPIWIKGAF